MKSWFWRTLFAIAFLAFATIGLANLWRIMPGINCGEEHGYSYCERVEENGEVTRLRNG
jgi:hypothetical protein